MPDEENLIAAEKLLEAAALRKRPSQDLSTMHDTQVIAKAESASAVKPIKIALRWNNILTGGSIAGIGAFLAWCLVTMTTLQGAQAQTSAKGEADHQTIVAHGTRLEALDSGFRGGMERLERKIDANNERQDKKLDDMQATLRVLVNEVRKR